MGVPVSWYFLLTLLRLGYCAYQANFHSFGSTHYHDSSIQQFATIYAQRLGFKESTLRKCLWGDFYFDPKTKRVLGHKHLKGRALKPMFVQLVLENIWAIYENVVLNP